MPSSKAQRPYESLRAAMPTSGSRDDRMQAFVDAAWDALHPTGVSWIGFYTAAPGDSEMILAVRRDKPACSPIGMHGACGKCFLDGRPLVVTDVARLGAGYIACDPRDKAEVVIPVYHKFKPWGVLDVDSYDVNAFSPDDALDLNDLLLDAGLSDQFFTMPAVQVV